VTQPLLLEEVHILRLAGIDEPFAVTSLSPGVNLVFGPNASGKSSLIRAIEAVLWPPAKNRALVTISARFHLGGDAWHVRADADSTRALRNGAPVSALALPSPEFRHRYRISLHDLLGSEVGDGGFAAAIARASVGGLDLAGAASTLGYNNKPPTRLQARSDWDASRVALDHAHHQAAALHREAEQLAELERARDDADLARHDIARIEAAMRWRDANARTRAAERALNTLPSGVGALTGREVADAESLLVQWRQLANDRARLNRERDDAARVMGELFPEHVPPDAERLAWRALVSRLRDCDERCERDTLSLRASEAERDHARQLCSVLATDTQLAQVDRSSLDAVMSFARRFEAAFGAWLAAGQQRDAMATLDASSTLGTTLSAESLRDLMRVLTRWLAADARRSARATSFGVWWWLLLTVAGLGWLLLAVRWHWSAALGAALALLIVVRARRAVPGELAEVGTLEREYNTLGGAPLVRWTSTDVSDALDQATRALAAARARERDDARRVDAERAMMHARAQLAPLESERAELVARWGVSPNADAQTLPWFVHQLVVWSDAHRAVIALEARVDAAIAARHTTVGELSALLAMHGIALPDSTARIGAMLEALDARSLAHREAQRACSDADRELRTLDTGAGAIRTAWQDLLGRASIAPLLLPDQLSIVDEQQLRHALDALEDRVRQRDWFLELSQRHRDATRDIDAAAATYVADEVFRALQHGSSDELTLAQTAATTRAAAYTELVERAATLRHRVDEAKRAHNVEAALARFDESSADLERAQQASLDTLVGNALLEYVQDETRDVHRPAVFHRARELFARITHGRWQLTLDERDSGTPGFRAIDSRTLRECPLDELSSGTRVQLLVAVRMAFVELSESTVRLPLFLDEALGTSDDQRAQALIDAALELASDGRQLFYFTAQRDEVAKWRAALADRNIAWKELDLATIRRGYEGEHAARTPRVRVVSPPRVELPDPDLHTHASFGAALNVPALRPGFTPTGAIHPWYVIDDVRVLHDVLSLGISSWGELQLFVDSRGRFAETRVSREDHAFALAQARLHMRAVEVLYREARIGRGDLVDRTRLIEAGVMQARLLDAVSAVAEACAGDAGALLHRLEDGDVAGFGPQRVRALRDRLLDIGCLDESTPRSASEIRLAMLAVVSDALPALAVDALLDRIASVQG